MSKVKKGEEQEGLLNVPKTKKIADDNSSGDGDFAEPKQ